MVWSPFRGRRASHASASKLRVMLVRVRPESWSCKRGESHTNGNLTQDYADVSRVIHGTLTPRRINYTRSQIKTKLLVELYRKRKLPTKFSQSDIITGLQEPSRLCLYIIRVYHILICPEIRFEGQTGCLNLQSWFGNVQALHGNEARLPWLRYCSPPCSPLTDQLHNRDPWSTTTPAQRPQIYRKIQRNTQLSKGY
jgi:hypothetical protein